MRQGSILAFLQPKAAPDTASYKAQPPPVRRSDVLDTTNDNPDVPNPDEGQKLTDNAKSQQSLDSTGIPREAISLENPRCAITKVYPSHLDRLKSITATLLPVRYSDRFFAECLELDTNSVIAYTAVFDSKPVGWIRCRVEPFPNSGNPTFQQIYVQALGILAPFRGIGLASALLKTTMSTAGEAKGIYAHVWKTNEDALSWYEKHGFHRVLLVPQYYRRLKPSGAWLVRKELT